MRILYKARKNFGEAAFLRRAFNVVRVRAIAAVIVVPGLVVVF